VSAHGVAEHEAREELSRSVPKFTAIFDKRRQSPLDPIAMGTANVLRSAYVPNFFGVLLNFLVAEIVDLKRKQRGVPDARRKHAQCKGVHLARDSKPDSSLSTEEVVAHLHILLDFGFVQQRGIFCSDGDEILPQLPSNLAILPPISPIIAWGQLDLLQVPSAPDGPLDPTPRRLTHSRHEAISARTRLIDTYSRMSP
jgi:hypothetical protein